MAKKHQIGEDNENNIFLEGNIPRDLIELDQTFRCPICANLFDKAVTIKECGHTYCSVCIQNYWVATRNGVHRQEKSCPICRTTVNVMNVQKALVMNRSIQESVEAFKQILLNRYRSSKDQIKDSPPHHKRRRRNSRKSSATVKYDQSPHGNEIFTSGDDSYSGDEEIPIQQKMESRNYARMKKKNLVSLCRQFNIPTSGSEQELMNRMRNYQNMWNAEFLHSIHPKKPSDIAAKLRREEQAQRDEKKRAQMTGATNSNECMRKLNATLKSGNEKITSGNVTFDGKLESTFEAMTSQLQSRMKKKVKSHTTTTKTLSIDKPVDGIYDSAKTQLSCGIEKGISLTVPTASSMEMIDVESCSDLSDRNIRHSTIVMNHKTMPLPSSTHSIASPKKKLSSSIPSSSCNNQSPVCSTESKIVQPVGRLLIANKCSVPPKKGSSPTSVLATTRIGWACGRCTYVNKGIDYVCQMCGYRKT